MPSQIIFESILKIKCYQLQNTNFIKTEYDLNFAITITINKLLTLYMATRFDLRIIKDYFVFYF